MCMKYKYSLVILFVSLFLHHLPAIAEAKGKLIDTNTVEQSMGYRKKCETAYATYFFEANKEHEASALVAEVDDLLKKAGAMMPIRKSGNLGGGLELYFTTGNMPSTSVGQLVIDPQCPFTGGILFCATNNYLPAWLCVGLERYLMEGSAVHQDIDPMQWVNKTKEENIPLFGDEWFIPGYIADTVSSEAQEMACGFVQHLNQTGLLKPLLSLYKTDREEAQKVVDIAWASYVGVPDAKLNHHCQYRYGIGGFMFDIYTAQATYHFGKTAWDIQTVYQYVFSMDAGIRYVRDWFDYDMDKLDCQLYTGDSITPMSGHATSGKRILLYYTDVYPPYVLTHEAVHAITYQKYGGLPSFTPFSEGLANVIMYEFEQSYKGLNYRKYAQAMEGAYRGFYDADSLNNYNRFSPAPYTPEDELLYAPLFHYEAQKNLSYRNGIASYPGMGWGGFRSHPNFSDDLNNHINATSFVYYLIEEYGREAFMEVYNSFDSIESIYGAAMEELISDWKYYLDR